MLTAIVDLPVVAQTVSIGIKAGVPVTDAFVLNNQASVLNNYTFNTQRYTIGPTFELRLPHDLAFETDALYKHLTYASNPFGFDTFRATTTATSWEFPLLVKRYFLREPFHPYGDLGVSFRHAGGSTHFTNDVFQSTQEPLELLHPWNTGFAAGGGAGIGIGRLIHVLPEIRYTRWGRENFISSNGVLGSNLNSVDLLIGVTFGK